MTRCDEVGVKKRHRWNNVAESQGRHLLRVLPCPPSSAKRVEGGVRMCVAVLRPGCEKREAREEGCENRTGRDWQREFFLGSIGP